MVNLKAGGKPIHSNFITEWIDLNKFVVSGVVVEKNGG
jgi:hypothetical protein